MKLFTIITAINLLFIIGCSGGAGNDAIQPSQDVMKNSESHACWGLWQFTADPGMGTLDIVPLRTGEMHVNVLPFLEPPPLLYLTLESLQFNGDIIEADIGLRHPFLGLTEFTGFDVCGVLITNGSIMGFDNPDLIMAATGDTYLRNPDGLTRWWNPSEFPNNGTMFGYKDGLLGAPDGSANYNSTLNGYKFFCDDLTDPDDSLDSLDPGNRCIFSAGQKNIRHYTIQLGSEGLVFNYAVDASWQFPQGDAPWDAPADFGPGANRQEAWHISVTELENTLFNDGAASGGDLSLLIDVWDHYNADMNTLMVESPGNFDPVSSGAFVGGGEGFSTYQVDIIDATPAADSIDILIEVECEDAGYQGMLPGEHVTAYFTASADVSDEPVVETCDFNMESFEIAETYFGLGYPNYIGAGGLKLSRQSSPQCMLFKGYHDSTYQSVYAMRTSDPNAGPIASYDNGEGFGFGISAIVVDGYSEPGIDRIFFMSGSGIANQLKSVDWNGTDFINPQTLPKPDTYGTWGLCVKPDGDLYLFNAYAYGPKFYHYDKSDGYSKTEIFTLELTTCDFENTGNFKGFVYNPELDALVLFCRNQDVSLGGQLYVIDLEGNLVYEDTDIFGTSTLICNLGGTYIDMADPDCRLLVYDATEDGTMYFARYSADLQEKMVVNQPGPAVGHAVCRGDIDESGTMWAVWDWHNLWYHYVFKLNPPADW